MSNQITGKAEIRIDGQKIAVENGATLTPHGVTRTAERHGGETFYSESEEPPMLEGNVLLTGDTDVIYLGNIKNATVLFTTDTGHQYVLRKAFTVDPVPHSGDGKAAIKMSGQSVEAM